MNQLIKDFLKSSKSIITFGLLAFIAAISFYLFNITVKIGEAVGKLIFQITH